MALCVHRNELPGDRRLKPASWPYLPALFDAENETAAETHAVRILPFDAVVGVFQIDNADTEPPFHGDVRSTAARDAEPITVCVCRDPVSEIVLIFDANPACRRVIERGYPAVRTNRELRTESIGPDFSKSTERDT